MTIAVRYLAQIRHAAGVIAERIELDQPARLPELVVWLAGRGEPLQRMLLKGDGRVQPALLLFVNDEQVAADSQRLLCDGDVVSILSPMAGG